MSEGRYKLKKGYRFIVAIDYVEPDQTPCMQVGDGSHLQFFHATNLNQARNRIKAEYEKTIAYAKELGIDTADEESFDAWMDPGNERYEIYAGDRFREIGNLYEAERA